MDEQLSERYANDLDGILSCYDRIVITGNLQPFCYAQGMTRYLYQEGIRIFDYAQFAEPLRARIRDAIACRRTGRSQRSEDRVYAQRQEGFSQREPHSKDLERTW